jgi:hypothetical protein
MDASVEEISRGRTVQSDRTRCAAINPTINRTGVANARAPNLLFRVVIPSSSNTLV